MLELSSVARLAVSPLRSFSPISAEDDRRVVNLEGNGGEEGKKWCFECFLDGGEL